MLSRLPSLPMPVSKNRQPQQTRKNSRRSAPKVSQRSAPRRLLLENHAGTFMSMASGTFGPGKHPGPPAATASGSSDLPDLSWANTAAGAAGRSAPAGTAARVRAGTPAELDTWTDRILTAPSLEALFAHG